MWEDKKIENTGMRSVEPPANEIDYDIEDFATCTFKMSPISRTKKYCYDFPRCSTTVDIVIIKHISKKEPCKVLLIKRANEPFKDSWAIPGGFLDLNETLLSAAKRELEEETGIRVPSLTPIGVYDSVNRDPRGRVITHVFAHIITDKKDYTPKAGDDAREAKFFPINKLPQMAFDHNKILRDTIEKMID